MAQQTFRQALFNRLFKRAVAAARQEGYDECHRSRQAQIDGLVSRLSNYENHMRKQDRMLQGSYVRKALLAGLSAAAAQYAEDGDANEFSLRAFDIVANLWYIEEDEAKRAEAEAVREARYGAAGLV